MSFPEFVNMTKKTPLFQFYYMTVMQVPVIQVWEDDSSQLKQSICFLAFCILTIP